MNVFDFIAVIWCLALFAVGWRVGREEATFGRLFFTLTLAIVALLGLLRVIDPLAFPGTVVGGIASFFGACAVTFFVLRLLR